MKTWKEYRRKPTVVEAIPWHPTMNMVGVSVSDTDTPRIGGMVCRNPNNHADKWYVAAEWWQQNMEV